MTTLKVDSNNDLYIDASNSMVLLDGIQAALQDCEHYAKSYKGEMMYQKELGVDYFGFVFNDSPQLPAFRQSLIENFKRVPDVVDVPRCDVALSGSVVNYVATIQTTFGEDTIQNGIA